MPVFFVTVIYGARIEQESHVPLDYKHKTSCVLGFPVTAPNIFELPGGFEK